MILRRAFLSQLALTGLATQVLPWGNIAAASTFKSAPNYLPLHSAQGTLPVPTGRRVPFGWGCFTLPVEAEGLVLEVGKSAARYTGTPRLRLMVALDTRDEREVEVTLAKSGKKIGVLSIWYASALQLFECELQASLKELQAQGVRLRLVRGSEPMYFVASSSQTGSHLWASQGTFSTPSEAFQSTFCSLRSLHPFGWMGGCTLDGLRALSQSGRFPAAQATLDAQLKLFVPDGENLIYENPQTQPSDNYFNNVEAGLPFVVISEKYPQHPSIKLFTDFCENRIENGQVKGASLTTEGCYTLAYPLAAVARATRNKDWYEYALIELEERIKYLTDDQAVYQRATKDGTTKGFRNWGRGYTWFLLGLARAGDILQKDSPFRGTSRLAHLREAYDYYARLALQHQQPDHSWRGYLDLPETPYDASATAGLGAALLYGKRAGWLPDFSEKRLVEIRSRLEKSLTPDGFLTGCCQINRGGETLQRSQYRVISQYVMGLMAHLYTANA